MFHVEQLGDIFMSDKIETKGQIIGHWSGMKYKVKIVFTKKDDDLWLAEVLTVENKTYVWFPRSRTVHNDELEEMQGDKNNGWDLTFAAFDMFGLDELLV